MKNKLNDYFYDRLSLSEEEEVQKYICTNSRSQELDDSLRSLFDECLSASGQQNRSQTIFRKIYPYIIAAAAVIALLIALPISYKAGLSTGEERIAAIEWVEVSVPFGEKQTVTLSDGTVLHINSGSRLTYPATFSGASRTVFMDGEAYLDVAKDPEHPFIIKSKGVDIKVLGTSFNFKNFAQEHTAELLLMDGSVEASVSVRNDTRVVRLKPGDQMKYNRENDKLDVIRFNPSGYKAFFEDNSLHFFDMEMADIAADLSRRFNCEIIVLDEKLASRRYFSIFTNDETLDQILAVMSSDGKMSVKRSGKTIYLQSK
ncbi:MAG: FecR domain-containing protein [Bacteroidales bacterium]|nr:FecR domain-containing protein [Bacteroidales bacterium]